MVVVFSHAIRMRWWVCNLKILHGVLRCAASDYEIMRFVLSQQKAADEALVWLAQLVLGVGSGPMLRWCVKQMELIRGLAPSSSS